MRRSSDERRHVRLAYQKALRPLMRYRKSGPAIEALLPDLRQVDPELRGEAARALEALGWQPETTAQRIDLLIAARRWKEVMHLDGAVERLLDVWKAWIWPEREGASVAESCAGGDSAPAAVTFLAPLLVSERDDLWQSLPVSRALMRIGTSQAIDALIYGGIALPGVGDGVAPRRGKLLCEADGEIVPERLLAALRDSEACDSVRSSAAELLAERKTPNVARALMEVVEGTRPGDRMPIIETGVDLHRTAERMIEKLGPVAADELLRALKESREPYVCAFAAAALGDLADRRAVDPLLTALRRSAAELKAGRKLGNAEALESIVGALGKLGDARAVDPIRECVQDAALLDQGESDACARLGINADRYEDGSWSRSFINEANRALTQLGRPRAAGT